MELASRIRTLADKYYDEVVRLRREIHSHPELAFEEIKTSTLVAETLKRAGIETKTGVAKTGVLGFINAGKSGRAIALRADMDALPIKEATGLPFASQNEGKMHACGHDAHTAIALGAGMILNELKDELNGEVRLVFQPSEERNPGGAPFMIEAGALDGIDEIYGLHVYAQSDAGTVGFCPGEMMASADELYITIKGKSGHGARPHQSIDPIVASAQVIMALQTIVSRNLDPFAQGVVTIGSIHAGFAPNIIPNEVKLVGTLRAMSKEWREYAHKRVKEIVEGISMAAGCEYDVHIDLGYPVLKNWDDQTFFAEAAAKEIFGESNVFAVDRFMGAEDFAYYLEKVPGTFYRLGIRNEAQGITADLHNDRFTIDEEALRTGIAMQAYLAVKALERK